MCNIRSDMKVWIIALYVSTQSLIALCNMCVSCRYINVYGDNPDLNTNPIRSGSYGLWISIYDENRIGFG